jgi:hypothetical protein
MSKYNSKPRDRQGSRKGTVAAKVNAVMRPTWQSIEQITRKVRGATAQQVKMRLHIGHYKGIYEYERIIRFKLKRKAKTK